MQIGKFKTMGEAKQHASTLPANMEIMIDQTSENIYMYDEGELSRDMVNMTFNGSAADFCK